MQFILLAASAFLIAVGFIASLLRVRPIIKTASLSPSYDDTLLAALPKASVIIFAHDNADSLSRLLPNVLSQDYPSGFEVIVVNDGESPEVRNLVDRFMLSHPNLYFTAAPDGARNLSPKKLALTLGVKAARYPVVVHTTADACIQSNKWLAAMMRHFDPEGSTDIVIGYASAPPYDDRSFGAAARSIDSIIEATGWLAPAANRHPWRGTEHNLAYRRDTFFRNKGFSRHLNLRDGDDDIFISEIARGSNTAVELSADSIVEVPHFNSPRVFIERYARRRFTKKFIRKRPRIVGTVASTAFCLAPLPLIALYLCGPVSVPAAIATAVLFILWFVSGMIWNSAVRLLHGRKMRLSTPFLLFSRPCRLAMRNVRTRLSHTKRYTWE